MFIGVHSWLNLGCGGAALGYPRFEDFRSFLKCRRSKARERIMNIRTDRLPDATTGGPKKIFAVLSRSVTVRGKTIRHVLIFDDHPASLRLLLGSDPAPRRRNEFLYVVLAIVLVLATGLGMFWPLL